jgi:hypothetical protein
MATWTGGAALLQWTQTGHKLTGTVQEVHVSSTQLRVETARGSITGNITGNLDGPPLIFIHETDGVLTWAGGAVVGGFELGRLLLFSVQQDGRLGPALFTPSTIATFKSAVAAIERGRQLRR